MTETTRHEPGMLCWADVTTPDQPGAKSFYSSLFGWQVRDEQIPSGVYMLASLRGKNVGAISPLNPRAPAKEARWNAYVCVADVEQAAKKVVPAGGTLLAAPFDVMGEGRMAVLQDPTGASLNLWQPLKHAGAGLMNEPGALCWAELMTRDTRAAGDFYEALFGWARQTRDFSGMRYIVFTSAQKPAAGMFEIRPEEVGRVPTSWMVYFAVASCDATVARAIQLGGKTYKDATNIEGVGRFAILGDPQGAGFGVLQPARMP